MPRIHRLGSGGTPAQAQFGLNDCLIDRSHSARSLSGRFQAQFLGPPHPSTMSRTWNTGLAVTSDLWFWSDCSGNALCPGAPALSWTEQFQEPWCAPVEMGHRPINKQGPDVIAHGSEPSESPVCRFEHEIGVSEKRPTIPKGNGGAAKTSPNELKIREQRVLSKEPAM